MSGSEKKVRTSGFFGNSEGNFAMMAGLFMPVLFAAGSLAVDVTNNMSMKTALQNAVDSAALATATRLYKEPDLSLLDAKSFAIQFLKGQLEDGGTAYSDFSIDPKVTITPTISNGATTWRVSIVLTGTQASSPLSRALGRDTLSVNVSGTSASGTETKKGSVSMALVLDKSGSMAWQLDGQIKMDVLKSAVSGLIQSFAVTDLKQEYVRLGAVTYNTQVNGSEKMTWDRDKVWKFVAGLVAEGGTDSTDAFKWGYTSVTDATEIDLHVNKTGQKPEKIIVFMTDGDNNYNSADTSTKTLCDKAKAERVTVFTIAFAAPPRGQQLLSYCASAPGNYFDAKNSADLISAFKNIGEKTAQVVSRLTE